MPFDASTLLDYFSSLAMLSLLAWSYGYIRRTMEGEAASQAVLGVFFGAIAFLQMSAPMEVLPGLIFDMRAVPVALAGAYLGWRGLVPCAAIAIATRASVGGVGMEAGILGIVIVAFAGLGWGETMRSRRAGGSLLSLLCLGALVQVDAIAVALLPPDMAWMVLTSILPPTAPLEIGGIVVIGILLTREGALLDGETRLRASASTDPGSGLLTEAALHRAWDHAIADDAPSRGVGLVRLRIRGLAWVRRTHGDEAVDLLRGALRHRIEADLPRSDHVALLDDGDLAVLLTDRDARDQGIYATSLQRRLSERPVVLAEGVEVRVRLDAGQTWDARSRPLAVQLEEAAHSLAHNARVNGGRTAPGAEQGGMRDALFARAASLAG